MCILFPTKIQAAKSAYEIKSYNIDMIVNENNSFILKETDFTDSASDTLFSDAYNDKGHLVLSVRRR